MKLTLRTATRETPEPEHREGGVFMARFVVTILYREPTWEARFGARARPCGGSFEVEAPDALTALATALVEFRQLEAASFTGWIRDIESASVQHVADSVAA